MLRDPKSGRAGLLIGSNIGFPIIVFRGQEHQNSRHQPQAQQLPQCNPRDCFSCKRFQQLPKEQAGYHRRKQQRDIGDCAGRNRFFQVGVAFLRQH